MGVRLIQVPYDSGLREQRMGRGPARFVEHGAVERLAEVAGSVETWVVEHGDGYPMEMALTFRINAHFLASTCSGRHLIDIGLREDLNICAEIDRHSVVPVMDDRVIQLRSEGAGSSGPNN